jgi:CDP-diacylglycerol pyrophosphatase
VKSQTGRQAVFRTRSLLRKVTNFAATMGLIAAMVAGQPHSVSAANRGELWFVVHDMCLPAYRSIGVAFPCAAINIANGLDRGFAVLQAPSSAAHVIVVPTTRISGIERPALQSENAPNYWEAASDARRFVEQGARRQLLRIGSSRKRIAPPAGFGERTQAARMPLPNNSTSSATAKSKNAPGPAASSRGPAARRKILR